MVIALGWNKFPVTENDCHQTGPEEGWGGGGGD